METMEILKLAAVILIGYFILKFIWGAAKGIIKLVLIILLIAVGAYFVKPELLYNVFGKEKVESVANDIKEESSELLEEGKDLVKDSTKSVVDSAEKEVKKAVESVTN